MQEMKKYREGNEVKKMNFIRIKVLAQTVVKSIIKVTFTKFLQALNKMFIALHNYSTLNYQKIIIFLYQVWLRD